ncbi:hypothetical protein [Streptomyces mirabilis]
MTEFVITPGLLLTLMIAVAAAIAVYLDTKRRSSETPLRGDLYMAITAGAAVATVLMGIGLASQPPQSVQTPVVAPAPPCPSPPAARPCPPLGATSPRTTWHRPPDAMPGRRPSR